MDELPDHCKLEIANKTLSSKEVIGHFTTVEKGVANHLTDKIISKRYKQKIRAEDVDEDAAALILECLEKSIEPNKMEEFLDALKKSQALHAKKIEEIYLKEKKAHKCGTCALPTPPNDDPQMELEEEDATASAAAGPTSKFEDPLVS